MVSVRRALLVDAVALACMLPGQRAFAHPLHTTLTEITEDRAHGVVRAMIRVFADDLDKSVQRFSRTAGAVGSASWNAAAMSYASSVFTMSPGRVGTTPLRACGITRRADVLWICLEASAPGGAASLQVRNGMLCGQFEDQVNVVQATYAGSRHSVLFTRGDRAKPFS